MVAAHALLYTAWERGAAHRRPALDAEPSDPNGVGGQDERKRRQP
jgi:hypothetical protein